MTETLVSLVQRIINQKTKQIFRDFNKINECWKS
jgi:hypothetical protein